VVTLAFIFGLITAGRYIFGGGSDTDTTDEVNTARDDLLTVDIDRAMVMTIRGPIVGDEKFYSEDVKITPTFRSYTLYNGYRDSIENEQSLDNNTPAYEQFVYALDKANLTAPGEYTSSEASDLRGICATGRVYEFAVYDGDARLQWFWTSTCKGSPGTLGASVDQVKNLFVAQVPGIEMQFASSANSFAF
jgi:hypothetical protein